MDENEYYVYCYLDTRNKHNKTYDSFEFEYEPIYIGKGKNNRAVRHLFLYKKYKTPLLFRVAKTAQKTYLF